jgi:kynurenine formamidase
MFAMIFRGATISMTALLVAGLMPFSGMSAEENGPISLESFQQWQKELSNWGRWGDKDEKGTLNLITPEVRKAAAALVEDGVSVSMAHNAIKSVELDASSPYEHRMLATGVNNEHAFAMDFVGVSYHGLGHTHLDAVCHMFMDGKLYNGYAKETVNDAGAEHLSVINIKDGVFTRGVLVDIPHLRGVPYLKPGTAIMPSELEAWEKKTGVTVREGDVVLVRTGRWARRAEKGAWDVGEEGAAGLHVTCAKWLRDRGVAAVGSDAALDAIPNFVKGVSQPLHALVLVAMGMPIFDNCDLQRVSAEAAKRNRWTFLLTASPLAVDGATGSPLNPIAVF